MCCSNQSLKRFWNNSLHSGQNSRRGYKDASLDMWTGEHLKLSTKKVSASALCIMFYSFLVIQQPALAAIQKYLLCMQLACTCTRNPSPASSTLLGQTDSKHHFAQSPGCPVGRVPCGQVSCVISGRPRTSELLHMRSSLEEGCFHWLVGVFSYSSAHSSLWVSISRVGRQKWIALLQPSAELVYTTHLPSVHLTQNISRMQRTLSQVFKVPQGRLWWFFVGLFVFAIRLHVSEKGLGAQLT